MLEECPKKKKKTNCGNAIAEIGKKKNLVIVAMPLPKMGGKKKLEWNCGNGIAEIGEFFFVNCGNVIAENGRKNKMWLPKSGEEFLKKKCYVHIIFTTFLQQITCY